MFEGSDKRRYLRFGAFLEGTFHSENDVEGLVMLTDLSREGIRLALNRPLEPAEIIKLEIWIPGSIIPVFIRAQVVWIEQGRKEWMYRYDAGVKIREIDIEDRQRITDFVYEEWRRKGAEV